MSDAWESYICQIDGHPASILVDVGLAGELEEIDGDTLLRLTLTLRHARPDGLSSAEEYDRLIAVEEAITPILEGAGATYAGRVTTAGHRTFYVYGEVAELELARLRREVQQLGYEMAIAQESDPDRRGYRQDLYPTPEEWAAIRDQKVFEVLRENGDALEAARTVVHFAYFPDRAGADGFARWAATEGLSTAGIEENAKAGADEDDERRFSVVLTGVATPRPGAFTELTNALRRAAEAHGGEYDGWETEVVASPLQ